MKETRTPSHAGPLIAFQGRSNNHNRRYRLGMEILRWGDGWIFVLHPIAEHLHDGAVGVQNIEPLQNIEPIGYRKPMTPMTYNRNVEGRRSIRLARYDYSKAGIYFITICTQNRLCLFGSIENGKMVLNDAGRIVRSCWSAIPDHYPQTQLHEYVIMPNHVHGIVGVQNIEPIRNFEPLRSPQQNRYQQVIPGSIGAIVRGFKIGATKWFRQNTSVGTVWQRNFYDHIIRDEKSYLKISEYIQTNPLTWREDRYYE